MYILKAPNDIRKAATGSDVVFTDKVVSMNDKINNCMALIEIRTGADHGRFLNEIQPLDTVNF